jgi:hypothetical protein
LPFKEGNVTTTTSTVVLRHRKARRWPLGVSMIVAATVSLGLWALAGAAVLRLL